MAGIAIALDLLRKDPNFYSARTIGFSAQAAAYAAAISVAADNPFASRFLFGTVIPVAYCDAGSTLAADDDYMSTIRFASKTVFAEHSHKEYSIELRPLYSAFRWKAFLLTSLRSFLMFYLPLLEPRASLEDDDEEDDDVVLEEHRVDLVIPFKKSVKQIIRETTVVTTRRILERIAVHKLSQRMAWKLLKDVPKSAIRKAQRSMPSYVFFLNVTKTTFRGHFLGVTASWLVQVGIEIYRFFSSVYNNANEVDEIEKLEKAKLLRKKISCATMRCGASLVFASIGAGIGATFFRPSTGQWIGCAIGDFAGPIIVTFCFEKVHLEL